MVAGLSVKEVANTVRKRRHDSASFLWWWRSRGSGIEGGDLHERSEDKMQRFIFGGSYPRTLHLTVIGAIGLPTLRFSGFGRWRCGQEIPGLVRGGDEPRRLGAVPAS